MASLTSAGVAPSDAITQPAGPERAHPVTNPSKTLSASCNWFPVQNYREGVLERNTSSECIMLLTNGTSFVARLIGLRGPSRTTCPTRCDDNVSVSAMCEIEMQSYLWEHYFIATREQKQRVMLSRRIYVLLISQDPRIVPYEKPM